MLKTEFEATFTNINKREIREKLKNIGAELLKAEFTQTRKVFNFPEENKNGFVRVRSENQEVTMALKFFEGDNIEDQKEAEIKVSDFDTAVIILKELGAKEKAFQETKRELWKLNNVEIAIDTWPFLEPFVEVEGFDEESVRMASQELGFDWKDAIFGPVTEQYHRKYNISKDQINNNTPKIIFDMENPFVC